MRQRRATQERRHAQEFEAFVGGAGGRLLHAATLLTGESVDAPVAAERLLTAALARTYANWPRLRGDDPYDQARRELASRFAHTAWRYRRARGGVLARLAPRERLVLVLRLYEGVAEEQIAAVLGLPAERVRAISTQAVTALRDRCSSAASDGPDTPHRQVPGRAGDAGRHAVSGRRPAPTRRPPAAVGRPAAPAGTGGAREASPSTTVSRSTALPEVPR